MGKGDKWRKGHSLKKFGNAYDDINWGKKSCQDIKGNSSIINSEESFKDTARKGRCSTNQTTSRYYTDI